MLRRIEAAGLDHVVVADHVSFHGGFGIDGIVDATVVAMLSESLPVHVGVYLLPLRHPVPVARQLATLADRAPGRITFGVGVGGEDPHESEICGVDPATRGRRMDEHLEVLRSLLAGAPVSFHGRFVSIDDAIISPPPSPPIPVVVGGRAEAALRRAGRFGDGWVGIFSTPEHYRERLATVVAAAAAAGRDAQCVHHGVQLWCGLGSDGRGALATAIESTYHLPFERFERFSPWGSPQDVASALRRYIAAGCTSFSIAPQASCWEEGIDALGEVRRLLNEPARQTTSL
jgi:alkanesulfonate monooxygenase SsuD/methylene tetrahydromethanopterin reductase-like flavin-dependent oxidoreductase (luciferase family)